MTSTNACRGLGSATRSGASSALSAEQYLTAILFANASGDGSGRWRYQGPNPTWKVTRSRARPNLSRCPPPIHVQSATSSRERGARATHDGLEERLMMQRRECDIRIIPTPVGWGVYCKSCKLRTGPFTKRPDADAAAN